MRIFFLAIIVTISVIVYGQNGEKNFIDLNYIEVIGKAKMEIPPDEIYLTVKINEKDVKNKTSLAELEIRMIEKLKEIGIDVAKDLMIKDIGSNFKYYVITKNKIHLSKEYQILVKNGKSASKIFIELEKIGISNITIDRLDNSSIEKYRNEVKVNAIRAAKSKAESLTTSIGQQIGKAIYIKELDKNYFLKREVNFKMRNIRSYREFASAPSQPEIDFEKIVLEYSILCRFELK